MGLSCAHGYVSARDHQIRLTQDKDVGEWAERNYTVVRDILLPGGTIAPEKFPKNVKWSVTVRISPPHEKPEYQFFMQKTYDGKVEVSVIAAKGASIFSQLQALEKKYRDAPVERIIGLIALERQTITQDDCPQLSSLANQFEGISMSLVLPDELSVDETGYELWSQSLWGNRLNVVLGGPGADAKEQSHPLLQWAEAARSFFEKHAGKQTSRTK
jgi:hypothetical protein